MQGFPVFGNGKLGTGGSLCYNSIGGPIQMTIRKRSLMIASLFAVASVLYGTAKHYAPSLVLFVVEQSLLQKAPSGIEPSSIHKRFHARIAAAPDRNSQMQQLLQISAYLEKVQHLTHKQLDKLLAIDKSDQPALPAGSWEETRQNRLFPGNWNFFS
jgi:hypothetical protein